MSDSLLLEEDDLDFSDKQINRITDIHNNEMIKEEKKSLKEMGFKEDLINKIYNNIHPLSLQEALDYLNKDDKDKFIHSFVPNDRNICLICEEKRDAHAVGDSSDIKDSESLFVTPNPDKERRDSLEKNKDKKDLKKNRYSYSYLYKVTCGICEEEISGAEKNKITQPCKHNFCENCWFEYLKEKINNANVYKIHCMEHECGYSLSEAFVKSIIGSDNQLLQKYDKFLTRRKIMESNKKMKFCPFPDCDGYAEKKNKKEKIVKCNFGHEFCFDCGNKPHPNQECSELIDKDFERWKSGRIIKRCPHCKFWTEKNEGCNHMTCIQCKFQWCWLCQKECLIGHYDSGACKGLHFEKEVSEEKTKQLLEKNRQNSKPKNIFCTILIDFGFFLIYLLLSPYFYIIGKGIKYMNNISNAAIPVIFGFCFLPFFIFIEVYSIIFIIIVSIPAIFIPPYFKYLRYFFFFRVFSTVITV